MTYSRVDFESVIGGIDECLGQNALEAPHQYRLSVKEQVEYARLQARESLHELSDSPATILFQSQGEYIKDEKSQRIVDRKLHVIRTMLRGLGCDDRSNFDLPPNRFNKVLDSGVMVSSNATYFRNLGRGVIRDVRFIAIEKLMQDEDRDLKIFDGTYPTKQILAFNLLATDEELMKAGVPNPTIDKFKSFKHR